MTYRLGRRSVRRLRGVHKDLADVVERAIELTPIDFTVGEGMRTLARQKKLVAEGKSTTLNSRHLTGHAVDLWPLHDGQPSWNWQHYYPMADAMKLAAEQLDIPLEWGGDWISFKDGPHFQLPRKQYK